MKEMKVIGWFLTIIVLIVGGIYVFSLLQELSYFALSGSFVETQTLVENPIQFSGRYLCTAGKYETDGKVNQLTPITGEKNKKIWIDAPVEISLWSSLKRKYFSDGIFTGTAKVCGAYSFTSDISHGFGPSGTYLFQITR